MAIDPIAIVIGGLAVWRVTHLLAAEDGPWDLVLKLRRAAGDGVWGRMLDCFNCLSLWIAASVALWLGSSWRERLLLWPALSAIAILVERLAREPATRQAAWREEDGEG